MRRVGLTSLATAAAVLLSLTAGATMRWVDSAEAFKLASGSRRFPSTMFKLAIAPVTPPASETPLQARVHKRQRHTVAHPASPGATAPGPGLEIDNHAAVAIELHPPPLAGGKRHGEPLRFNDVVCVPLVMVNANRTVKAGTKPRWPECYWGDGIHPLRDKALRTTASVDVVAVGVHPNNEAENVHERRFDAAARDGLHDQLHEEIQQLQKARDKHKHER